MKIVISTLGSRGDIQPYLALAVGLQQAGHQVTLAAPQAFASWIRAYGVTAQPLSFDPQAAMHSLSKQRNQLQALRAMRTVIETGAFQALEECWQASQECDFFIQTGTGSNALEIASRRGIPVAFSYLVPMAPTRSFPMFMLPFRFSLGGSYNYLTHLLVRWILWVGMGGGLANRWRLRLGLPAWRSQAEMQAQIQQLRAPSLYGYSPSLLPKPLDWDERQHVTGYWFLEPPPGWQAPLELMTFLESGSAPVYIGFGSLSQAEPERHLHLALRALEISGQRGIVLTSADRLPTAPVSPNVFFCADVPHAWLFPRLAAVVHHGGAGTTAAALRAGVPGIITPFGGDQFAWAHLVVKAGVAPPTPGIKSLTAERLAQSINRALTDTALQTRASALGEKIRLENGISQASAVIEHHAH